MSWTDQFLKKTKQKDVSNKVTNVTNKKPKETKVVDHDRPMVNRPRQRAKQLPSFIKIEKQLMKLHREGSLTPTEKKLFDRLCKPPYRDRWIAEKLLDFLKEYF